MRFGNHAKFRCLDADVIQSHFFIGFEFLDQFVRGLATVDSGKGCLMKKPPRFPVDQNGQFLDDPIGWAVPVQGFDQNPFRIRNVDLEFSTG